MYLRSTVIDLKNLVNRNGIQLYIPFMFTFLEDVYPKIYALCVHTYKHISCNTVSYMTTFLCDCV